ncbi:hypothetical protein BHYA_0244g00080 [Botrytis hyacinthi]|uniref:Uncharacterized protein n=1 Tax=Botrytis hyacinthi TaxID=278943 RepID=A0A4Z1GG47_9HELO|nr:hypothetical protein BHYA_0244g00080 [Botrytis hyacinthi]
MIAATPINVTFEWDWNWSQVVRSITTFPRDLLLARDLGGSRKKLGSLESENLKIPVNSNSMVEENLETYEIQGAKEDIETNEEIYESSEVKIHIKTEGCSNLERSSEAKENFDIDEHSIAEEYSEADEHLSLDGYSETGSRIWDNVIRLRNVALILRDLRLNDNAEDLFLHLIRTRKQLQGVEHPQTLSSIADLQLHYRERRLLDGTEELEAMKNLLETGESAAQVSEKEVVEIASLSSCKAMMIILERRGDQVPITEEVVKAAAANEKCGLDMMELLLRRRENLSVTEEVVKAAVLRATAENEWEGSDIIKLLFEKRGDQIPVTEEVLKVAAGNEGYAGGRMLLYLFEKFGELFPITEETLKEILELTAKRWNPDFAKRLSTWKLKGRGN